MQVEHAWIQVLAGTDLVAQEVLAQQLQVLKVELGGPSPTPLEQLLIERIVVSWVQVCQAEIWRHAMSLSMMRGSNSGKIGHRDDCWRPSKR